MPTRDGAGRPSITTGSTPQLRPALRQSARVRRLYIEYLGDSIELPRGETVVGREVGCALRFNDPTVSRRHLRFIRRKDEAFVEDLSSSNGTLVNGRSISASLRIHDGDVISVGSRTLTIRVVGERGLETPATLDADNDSDLITQPQVLEGQAIETQEDANLARAHTSQIKRVPKPADANQRCPSCSAPVRDTDAECAVCGFRWGTRPATPTLNPLDRRRHDRHSMELRLIYVSSELEIEATTLDLSHSGVFVRTQILDPVGTDCRLTILIDGGPALEVNGVVRRVVSHNERGEPVGLGVELSDLGKAEREWIDVVLARMAS